MRPKCVAIIDCNESRCDDCERKGTGLFKFSGCDAQTLKAYFTPAERIAALKSALKELTGKDYEPTN